MNVSGTWVGYVFVSSGLLAAGGGTSGEFQLTLTQEGEGFTGRGTGPGFRGTVQGRLYPDGFYGSATGEAGQGAGNLPFSGVVVGDTMEATIEHTAMVLRRRSVAGQVLMKNPRTDQVLKCEGPPEDVEGCVRDLERDGWRRLTGQR